MKYEFHNKISRNVYAFNNKDEFSAWATAERSFYEAILPHVRSGSGVVNNQLNVLKIIFEALTKNLPLSDAEQAFDEHYIPYQGFLSLVIAPTDSEMLRATIIDYVGNPFGQRLPDQSNQLAQMQAVLLGRIIRSYGNPDHLVMEIASAIERQLHSVAATQAFLEEKNLEWETQKAKIDGLVAQAELEAPTDFWKKRGDSKGGSLSKMKLTWYFSLLIILTIIVVFGWISWRFQLQSTNLPDLVERVLVFGSFASITVWWSRQALKDVRLTEYLVEDAEERVAMIKTFAALKARQLGGDDYQVILNALFRPAGTHSSDDGGPKLPVEILIKTLTERAKGS